jgi:hypothetical protein
MLKPDEACGVVFTKWMTSIGVEGSNSKPYWINGSKFFYDQKNRKKISIFLPIMEFD